MSTPATTKEKRNKKNDVKASGLLLMALQNKWYQRFGLRNFDLEDMELESTNSGPTTKLPMLKSGEYDMWNDITATKMSTPATTKEKRNKKNNVKASGLLLMALPNEHQLIFSQYPDAKSMFAAIETRFGGNAATKKTLLKQQYENFSVTSTESLDSIFNRLQKIVSRLAILGVIIAQEDLNLKILSSLPPNVSDNTVYAFMVENPNGSNVLHQDLKKIHEDGLEVMDLKWQLSLLSMRAKEYYQRIGKKIFINANDIAGYDKSKVECYNYHKLGHFTRECRAPRSKEGQFKNQDNTMKQVNTARPKVVVNVVRKNQVNAVKASACWVWRSVKPNSASITLKRYDYVDARGRSRGIVSRNNYNRVDAKNTHPNVLRNMSPKAVLLKTGLVPLNIVRRSVHEVKRHYYTGRHNAVNTARSYTEQVNVVRGKPQHDDKGFVDSGCSRHMTGNIACLSDFKQFNGGYVAFGGGAYGG
ncbi:ribonuclease H-like domain-containing protein [Tanacetum coccineum]